MAKKIKCRELLDRLNKRGVRGVSDDPATAVKQLGLDVPVVEYARTLQELLDDRVVFSVPLACTDGRNRCRVVARHHAPADLVSASST